MEETQRFTIYPSPELLQRLKKVAKANHRSANHEILLAIEEHLHQEEKRKDAHREDRHL